MAKKIIRLPYPYKKQREILLDDHRFKVLNIGRRSGKSMLAGLKSILNAIDTGHSSLIISAKKSASDSVNTIYSV